MESTSVIRVQIWLNWTSPGRVVTDASVTGVSGLRMALLLGSGLVWLVSETAAQGEVLSPRKEKQAAVRGPFSKGNNGSEPGSPVVGGPQR
jgi:hypothetical protein